MSRKVVLTVEQDKAIKELKRIQSNKQENERNGHLIKEKNRGGWRSEDFKAANDIPFESFVDALIKGYEVEKPKFEIGDIIVGLKTGNVYKVVDFISLDRMKVTFIYKKSKNPFKKVNVLVMDVRHATKEEIIFAELGREVGEFVEGDVILTKYHNMYRVIGDDECESAGFAQLSEVKRWLKETTIVGFYPNSSFTRLT